MNTTAEEEEEVDLWQSPYTSGTIVTVALIMCLLSLTTVLGNGLVLLSYHLDTNIRKQMNNRFIISLAVSDMVIGLEGFPLFTTYVLCGERWPLGGWLCETWLFLDYTLCLVSILTVLLITVDRYLSVCHTAAYLRWQSVPRINALLAASWTIPAVFFAFVIYAWQAMTGLLFGVAHSSTGESVPPGTCAAPFLNNQWVNLAMYFTYYWSTLAAMLILYTGIHKASTKLQMKGDAREKRTIALLMGQRLGAQVGVRMCMQEGEKEVKEERRSSLNVPHNRSMQSSFKRFIRNNVRSALNSPVDKRRMPLPEATTSGYNTGNSLAHNVTITTMSSQGGREEEEEDTIYEVCTVRKTASSARTSMSNASFYSMELYSWPDALSLSSKFADANLSSVLNMDSTALTQTSSFNAHKNSSFASSDRQSSILGQRNGGSVRVHDRPVKQPSTATVDGESTDVKPPQQGLGVIQSDRPLIKMKSTPLIGGIDRPSVEENTEMDDVLSDDDDSGNVDKRGLQAAAQHAKHARPSIAQRIVHRVRRSYRGASLSTLSCESDELHSRYSILNGVKRYFREADVVRAPPTFLQSLLNPVAIFKPRKRTRAERRARKAFRTITFIVGFFAALWSPYFIAATVYGFCPRCVPGWLFNICYYLCYINSTGNPFMYAMANRQFKTVFTRILRGDFRKL